MAAAARLATRTRPIARPNPGVAALVVRDGALIGRGWTQAGGRPHAEKYALENLPDGGAKGATMYVTLEPCAHQSERGPACCDVVAAASPKRVVIGQIDPDPRTTGKGIAALDEAGIATEVLGDTASVRSLAGFLSRQRRGRPYVTLKLAMSLDGCIALADGTSQWITGEAARAHVHAVRAKNDAILVGGGTWRSDQPRLDVRLPGLEARSPDRVVLTSAAMPHGVIALASPEAISTLANTHYLYVEGGAQTAASFLAADLVDELHIYRAPFVIGDGLRALGPLGLDDLAAAHGRWALDVRRMLGSDTFEAYLRQRK
ncbi:bifunctional diaminohydroxyphosphoribosylaminopyrimidine deaminase/5-amino-6-(5-phosphoribosylamino)uracil reductase RibD [Erythrobacter sp. YT30]|uniref:bifunctional diaminohydroxyphosphoribosylaminopyrimidine deaminase/5-amino-6-(5-phosphoribosylamino)uracil reductase RibD n=1 Tax=Erythrobacter sp. YT30 TaxID=1735012 RepID=UPI00076DCA8C|nr:bifunctional diaminohydroxyphosphoribosylaminopyrimidine deaminase/5-amino-6-(5-phosphoribosylamino)uracil reductase RibD [Erythrobacter sp. YT30]KWV91037.1 riboflavin biosynthesis protein RibD [Erythrobacter sp. YT30]